MNLHELKTWPAYFDAVWRQEKTFEVRKNDRGFQVGDWLWLREYDPQLETYSGRSLIADVVYILDGFAGLTDGYCAMSIVVQEKRKALL